MGYAAEPVEADGAGLGVDLAALWLGAGAGAGAAVFVSARQDWTVWSVDVRDAAGRPVLLRAFTDAREVKRLA